MHGAVYLQYVLALLFVLALIGLAALAARRFGLVRGVPMGGRRRRLSIVEILPLDAKRRLLLLRRDGVEHLVLLGAGGDTVIETGIAATPPEEFAAVLRDQIPSATQPEPVA